TADKSGKDIPRPCFVSYDPEAYLNEKSKVWTIPIDYQSNTPTAKNTFILNKNDLDTNDHFDDEQEAISNRAAFLKAKNFKRVAYIIEQAERENIDLTGDYDDWQLIAFSLAHFGEKARPFFHRVSSLYTEYDKNQADEKFTNALQKGRFKTPNKFFTIAKEYGLKTQLPITIDEAKAKAEVKDIIGNDHDAEDYLKFGIWEHNNVYR